MAGSAESLCIFLNNNEGKGRVSLLNKQRELSHWEFTIV